MRDKVKNDSNTKHIKVTVTSGSSGYVAEYDPKVIRIDENDEILSFRLVQPTPDDILFDCVSITPSEQTQFSQPSISPNGKHMILSDANTVKGLFHLDFTYKSKKGEVSSTISASCARDGDGDNDSDYPIVDNNPPG
jgi:hypothetical protein